MPAARLPRWANRYPPRGFAPRSARRYTKPRGSPLLTTGTTSAVSLRGVSFARRLGVNIECRLTLIRPGGLILIDNTFHMGQIAERERWSENTPVVDALNRKIHGDERVTIAMLPVGDGLTICRKRG